MKDIVILFVHLLTAAAKLLGPGGARAIIAENLLLKQQLLEYCQVNVIQTTQPIAGFIPLPLGYNLGARHLLPLTKCPRTKLPIVNRSRQMTAQPEQIPYHSVNRKKALSLSS